MSKYSVKHSSPPPCAHRECGGEGTKLARVGGRPVWVCPSHAEQLLRPPGA